MKCNQCKSKVKLIFESKTDKELELICSQCNRELPITYTNLI